MGRRSRQRAGTPPRDAAPSATADRGREGAPRRPAGASATRSRRGDAPLPPWGSFPLIELAALAAIVCGVWGLVAGGRLGGVLLTVAMLLGSVAGLEVAIREHMGGYRSHTLVLSGTLAVATLAILFLAEAGRTVMIGAALAVLAAALLGFRQLFKHRSGGASIRVR